jgi:hypothetical protein
VKRESRKQPKQLSFFFFFFYFLTTLCATDFANSLWKTTGLVATRDTTPSTQADETVVVDSET